MILLLKILMIALFLLIFRKRYTCERKRVRKLQKRTYHTNMVRLSLVGLSPIFLAMLQNSILIISYKKIQCESKGIQGCPNQTESDIVSMISIVVEIFLPRPLCLVSQQNESNLSFFLQFKN